jgi:hypothetical protein
MALVLDPVTLLNLIFDLIILCLGVFAYVKIKGTAGLVIGIGFAFFAISYVITILGYGSLTTVLVPLRVIGYLSVIGGLYLYLKKR